METNKDKKSMGFRVVGVNDERDFCECCGKQNLKRVVWIENVETGEVKHFGTICAASPVKGFGVEKEIKASISDWETKNKQARQAAIRIYRERGGKFEASNVVDMSWYEGLVSHFLERFFAMDRNYAKR